MTVHTLEQRQHLAISREEAWQFFGTPRNLADLTPPDIGFEIVRQPGDHLFDGQIIVYRFRVLPVIPMTWVTEIKCVDEGKSFIDEQRSGPYQFWHHRHTFEDAPGGGVIIGDVVNYAVGWGPIIGGIVHHLFVRRKLESIFAFRRQYLAKRFGEIC